MRCNGLPGLQLAAANSAQSILRTAAFMEWQQEGPNSHHWPLHWYACAVIGTDGD